MNVGFISHFLKTFFLTTFRNPNFVAKTILLQCSVFQKNMSDIANHYKKHYTEFFSATITYIFFYNCNYFFGVCRSELQSWTMDCSDFQKGMVCWRSLFCWRWYDTSEMHETNWRQFKQICLARQRWCKLAHSHRNIL